MTLPVSPPQKKILSQVNMKMLLPYFGNFAPNHHFNVHGEGYMHNTLIVSDFDSQQNVLKHNTALHLCQGEEKNGCGCHGNLPADARNLLRVNMSVGARIYN